MSEQNESTNGKETKEQRKKRLEERKARQAARGPYKTIEEANANKPKTGTNRLYRVAAPNGDVYFVWSFLSNNAIELAAKTAGWTVTEQDKAPSKEKVAGLLAALSPEDRAVLIAQYVPPSKGKK